MAVSLLYWVKGINNSNRGASFFAESSLFKSSHVRSGPVISFSLHNNFYYFQFYFHWRLHSFCIVLAGLTLDARGGGCSRYFQPGAGGWLVFFFPFPNQPSPSCPAIHLLLQTTLLVSRRTRKFWSTSDGTICMANAGTNCALTWRANNVFTGQVECRDNNLQLWCIMGMGIPIQIYLPILFYYFWETNPRTCHHQFQAHEKKKKKLLIKIHGGRQY